MKWLAFSIGAIGLWALIAAMWRHTDRTAEASVRNELLRRAGPAGAPFDVSAVAGLPEPAQRYFRYTIAPGTPLVSVVEIAMTGKLGLGDKREPGYQPMTADQILAPPAGLLWRVQTRMLAGSDAVTPATSWTRFWLFGLVPVARVAGNADHHRSAFGRVVAEAAFWAPATLLPGSHVTWEAVEADTARAVVSFGGFTQSIDLTVEADGRPSKVVIQRWSNENADKEFREQPFGGYLSDFRDVGGYRLPMHVEGGNLIGTDDYFPFYIADVEQIGFPQLTTTTQREAPERR